MPTAKETRSKKTSNSNKGNTTGVEKSKTSAGRAKGLGRGLSALLEGHELNLESEKESVYQIDIDDISPMENQPRKIFDDDKLQELAESIRENGIIQPIIVHKRGLNDYVLVAGERRWRAARMAGLREVPAIVRTLDKEKQLKQALIENIQRENLNPLEEATAYQQLLDEYGLTQEEVAKVLGKSRSAVANTLRLKRLPVEIQDFINSGSLSEGHARALLALPEAIQQIEAADHILDKGLNVRQTEEYIRLLLNPPTKNTAKPKDVQAEISVRDLELKLSRSLGTKVRLSDKNGKGLIKIPYKNLDELDRILELLNVRV